MRDWLYSRRQAMLELAPEDESGRAGVDVDRAQAYIAGKGLAVRDCIVTSPDELRRYRDRLAGAGYPMAALDAILDPGNPAGAVSIPETGVIVALWVRDMPLFSETLLVHELAHGSMSVPQEWAAEPYPDGWLLWLPRSGFVVKPAPAAVTGDFLEEGFAQMLAGEYARDVLGGEGLVPAGRIPARLADIPGHVWESATQPDNPVHTGSAWAAAALQALTGARPGLYGALIRARREPAGLTEVAREIESVRRGLYRRLRAVPYTVDGFREGLAAVRGALDSAPALTACR